MADDRLAAGLDGVAIGADADLGKSSNTTPPVRLRSFSTLGWKRLCT
jgi:hypothetical protein